MNLAALDKLMNSEELWVERNDHARTIAARLVESKAPIIVLYGAGESGKSELIRRVVIPMLQTAWGDRPVVKRPEGRTEAIRTVGPTLIEGPVLYVNGSLPELDNATQGGLVIIDSFEQLLIAAGADRDRRFAELAQTALRRGTTLVLIVRQDYLSRLFQLQHVLPGCMDAAFEIPAISEERMFEGFAAALRARDIHPSDSALDALFQDVKTVSGDSPLNPQLLGILVFELERTANRDGSIRPSVADILEAHLDFLFEGVSDRFDPQIVWAVLNDVVSSSADAPFDAADVANRFDVSPDVPASIIDWLEKERRILRRDSQNRLLVYPRQLGHVTAAKVERERERDADDRLIVVLRQAARHFAETGGLLSESSFKRIHARRSSIRTSEDEAKLMLTCAIAFEDARSGGATEHWLRRLKNPANAIDVLLDCTFDSRPEVRLKAASHLHQFNDSEVRHQLHLLALRDSTNTVREQAIESLSVIQDDGLRSALIQEARELKSPYRLQAIDALRIFNDRESVQTLLGIARDSSGTGDSQARSTAIRVLGRQDAEQSADALLNIALQDDDRTNQQNAAMALSGLKSEQTLRYVLDKLRLLKPESNRPQQAFTLNDFLKSSAAAAGAALAVAATFITHGLMLLTLGWWRLAIALTGVQVAAAILIVSQLRFFDVAGAWLWVITLAIGFLLPTRFALAQRGDRNRHGPYRRWLDRILFAVDFLTIFLLAPGLAPMLAGRVRRGFVLIGIELAGIGLVAGALLFRDVFGAFESLSWIFVFVPAAMFLIGAVALGFAYAAGLIYTTIEVFLRPFRQEWRDRLTRVYSEVLRNDTAAKIVCGKLAAGNVADEKWAAMMVRRYDQLLRRPLVQWWDAAPDPARQKILAFIVRNPTEDSLDLLKRSVGRLRYGLAVWNFRLSVWPKDLMIFALLALLALLTATAVLYTWQQNTPDTLMTIARNPSLAQEQREAAVDKLHKLAASGNSAYAQAALDELSTLVQIRPPTGRVDPEFDLKMEALNAIARIRSDEALHALVNIGNNAPSKEIRDAAKGALDPVELAQHKLDETLFEEAITDATAALQSYLDDTRAQQTRTILARANLGLVNRSADAGNYAAAKKYFNGALDAKGDLDADEVIDAGLNLAYRLHEFEALQNPEAYGDTLDVLSRLYELRSSYQATDVAANLAEAYLTVGKNDDAIRIAQELLKDPNLAPYPKINMLAIDYAARLLKGDVPGAARTKQEITRFFASPPADFTNAWSYAGTRNYFGQTGVAPEAMKELAAVLDQVEGK